MAPFPIPVRAVDVFLYIPDAPLELRVYSGGTGVYSIGTLLTNVFYNLSLRGGTVENGGPQQGASYRFVGYGEGGAVDMHWMHCTKGGDTPEFGLIQGLFTGSAPAPFYKGSESEYLHLGKIDDLNIEYYTQPDIVTVVTLMEDGTGELIGTRVGTPHLMGIQADLGDQASFVHVGMKGTFSAAGKLVSSGRQIGYSGLQIASKEGTVCTFLYSILPLHP